MSLTKFWLESEQVITTKNVSNCKVLNVLGIV